MFAGDDQSKEKGTDDTDTKDKKNDDPKGTLTLELVCHGKGDAEFRVVNDDTKNAKVDWKVSIDDFDFEDLDDLTDANGIEDIPDDNGFEDIDDLDDITDANGIEDVPDDNGFEDAFDVGDLDLEDLEGKQVTLEGTTLDVGKRMFDLRQVVSEKRLKEMGIDVDKLSGTLTVPKNADETFWAGIISKDSNVDLYYDGKKVDSVKVDEADCKGDDSKKKNGDYIELEPVCYKDAETDIADLDDTTVGNTVGSDVTGVDEDFDPDGEMIVDGEEVDEDDYDGAVDAENNVIDDSGFSTDDLDGLEGTATVREAKFRVHNRSKKEVKVNWSVEGDGQGGKLYLDGKESTTFRVTEHNDRKTYVTLTDDGKEIASEKPADTECDDDCNT
ncbi:hypothetical protein C493_05645 [Natronolimnohabitans innermongolicus JCM 12255]|uniref:Uncharacterized protein n=1 Tax=Natronolimnohabitans innermongolicus JCM 12255 TaxID=1227499 RepID=L9XAY9_9EURY|nr:hypothetical protein C493_05645 [Natronolimnohabitans innermongolicus JCM 12255]